MQGGAYLTSENVLPAAAVGTGVGLLTRSPGWGLLAAAATPAVMNALEGRKITQSRGRAILGGKKSRKSSKSCAKNQILRKSQTRKSRSGKSVRVPAACIANRGAPGKWTTVNRSKGIGKLREGTLSRHGQSVTDSATARHAALRKAVAADGALSIFRRLNATATQTKRTSPKKSKTFLEDRDWVRANLFKQSLQVQRKLKCKGQLHRIVA